MSRRFWVIALQIVLLAGVAGAAWTLMAREHPPGDPSDGEQVALGGALYATNCARCHGKDLGGELGWVKEETGISDDQIDKITERLGDVAPAHDERGSTSRLSDDVLFEVIDEGPEKVLDKPGSRMSGFGDRLGDEDIWAIIAYMKSHWPDTDTTPATEIDDD